MRIQGASRAIGSPQERFQREHRYSIATRLKVEEKYLWPDALSQEQVAAAFESEIVAICPHRSDIAERLDAGQPWTTKRMRQRSDYLWRMLTRASARATPRGWLAHVAALTVAEHGWSAGQPITIDSQAAAETVDNIDDVRGDNDYYLRGETPTAQLTICHGTPGILAVAGMFAASSAMPEAAALARHLYDALSEQVPSWCETTAAATTVLDGTAGTLALLATDRDYIACLSPLGLASRHTTADGHCHQQAFVT